MRADHVSVKEAVLPFDRFEGSDAILGPEMRSTGEVMGIARDFPTAFAKAQAAAGAAAARQRHGLHHAHRLRQARGGRRSRRSSTTTASGSSPRAGTKEAIERMGIPATELKKIGEGSPNVVDWIENGDVDLVVNTPTGSGARSDGWQIRRAAIARGIPCLTTLSGGAGRRARDRRRARRASAEVLSLQEIHAGRVPAEAGDVRPGASRARRRPFGRRTLRVAERRVGRRLRGPRRRGPRWPRARAPASSTCSPRRERWGGGRRRAPVPAAGLQRPARERRPPRVHARGRRSRHRAPVRARRPATAWT